MRIREIAPLILILAALCAACAAPGPDDPVDSDDTPPASVDTGPGAVLVISNGNRGGGESGMSVAEALDHRATDDLLFVTGALFIDPDGTVLLCDTIAESFPPQCGGVRLEVQGLDLSTIDGLEEASGVRWAEGVILFGSVE
jgi:hypothetical protein